MSRKPTIKAPMSGLEFQKFLKEEIERRNSGLERLYLSDLGKLCGCSGRYIGHLLADDDPNPTTRMMRCILFTLGYAIEKPEEDVIPFLKSKSVYDPEIHGVERK